MLLAFYISVGQISNSSKIIGQSIRIGKLQVAQKDFPTRLNWPDAKVACVNLGKGWRLPSKEELNVLYQNKEKIGGFAPYAYWSSTEVNADLVMLQNFNGGGQYAVTYKNDPAYVRAVKTL